MWWKFRCGLNWSRRRRPSSGDTEYEKTPIEQQQRVGQANSQKVQSGMEGVDQRMMILHKLTATTN
jgi:hypothetical protein